MPVLAIIDAGVTSIQGLGRYGSQRYGIAPGGAMDRMALAEANALTGQPAGGAAIEIGPLPAKFAVSGGAVRIAVTGAEREVFINDQSLPLGVTQLASVGDNVTLRGARRGQYSYISIQGGMQGRDGDAGNPAADEPPAARNTWVLRQGDRIYTSTAVRAVSESRLRLQRRFALPIRVVLGPQQDYFSTDALNAFLSTNWVVSHAANRMAYMLEGGRIEPERGFDMVSDGTVTGNIQISGNGQPIVILNDRGTVGGYPKIATIISADLGRFAQTSVSETLRFEAVSVTEAQVHARNFAFELANVKPKLEVLRAARPVSEVVLIGSNIAGDVFNPADWLTDNSSSDSMRAEDL